MLNASFMTLYVLLPLLLLQPNQCRCSSIRGVMHNNNKITKKGIHHQAERTLWDIQYASMIQERYNISSEQYMHYVIPQQYIVGFDFTIRTTTTTTTTPPNNITDYVNRLLQTNNFVDATVLWSYDHPYYTIPAVTIAGVNDVLYTTLELDPYVVLIEPDVIVTLDTISTSNWQSNPPNWGLDRIDQLSFNNNNPNPNPPFNDRYNFDQTGQGAVVFIVDTGIRWGHDEFHNDPNDVSRVHCGYDAYNFNPQLYTDDWDNGCYDGVGHGTHIAAIVGGSVYGVAKDVTMVSVKVFTSDGRGSVGSVLAGLDYIMKKKDTVRDVGMIVNLSFGTPIRLNIFHKTVTDVVSNGIVVTASAGNDATDACTKFPGAIPDVITVGSSTIYDAVSKYSNVGPCINIFAPGEQITSAWRDSNIDRATISGTSQSSAFVAGVVALIYEVDPTIQPNEMKQYVLNMALIDVLTGIPDESETANLLLNMGSLELAT